MSWLSRVRSGIPFLPKRQTPDNLWHKCGKCQSMVFTKEWEENLYCCPRCEHHDRIGPKARFEQLFDDGKHDVLPSPDVREDPLRFRDAKRYTDRLKAARSSTEEKDALINARGKIGRRKAADLRSGATLPRPLAASRNCAGQILITERCSTEPCMDRRLKRRPGSPP